MPQPYWKENFDFYFTAVARSRVVVNIDLGAADQAPLASHPIRVMVRILMMQPRADGLRHKAEAPALFALEDVLVERFAALGDAVFVGRTVAEGQVHLVFYAPEAVRFQESTLSRVVEEERGDYDTQLQVESDPDWRFYLDFLFPSVYDLQIMLNRRLLDTLEEHGDDSSLPRQVEHFAYFPDEARAAAAAVDLRAAGFQTDEPDLDDEDLPPLETPANDAVDEVAAEPDEAEPRWLLAFTREDRLGGGRIDEICVEILDLILPHQGDYDGWGAEIRRE